MISTTTYQKSFLRSANGGYRYFFNGQESDGEVYGEGVSLRRIGQNAG
ncbi:MAG: hypothetical protein MJZ87_02485 [Bacteroidales bacterium]|nr:hypothetical protein [Bacteroidales bacterium]